MIYSYWLSDAVNCCLFRYLAVALRVSHSRRDFEGVVRGMLEVSTYSFFCLFLFFVSDHQIVEDLRITVIVQIPPTTTGDHS